MSQGVSYKFGFFHFDPAGLLLWKKKKVHLTPKEAGVLRVLLENAGALVEKEEFRKKAWPELREGGVYFDNCLKRTIATLRKALKKKDRTQYIEMLSKRGYRFVGDVKVISDDNNGKIMVAVLPFRSV